MLRSQAPLALRPTPEALYVVGSAAGPLGGDQLALSVELVAGAVLTLRTTAAGLALPGTAGGGPSRMRVDVTVGSGARLRWLPEPLIAVAGCRHHALARVRLHDGASVEWREELVLGRSGEPPGSLRMALWVDVADRPLLRSELAVGPDAPGWDGPAVLGCARAAGHLLLAGAGLPPLAEAVPLGESAAVLPLAGPGILVNAVAADARALRALLDAASAHLAAI